MTDIAIAQKPGFSFIATTPAQMEVAQQQMTIWCDERIEREKLEVAELERTIAEAQKAGIKDQAWKRRLALSRAKMTFYRKVKAALLKGYYLVPPFPVQLFAIRTDKDWPKEQRSDYQHANREQGARRLDIGEGEYFSPVPIVRGDNYQDRDKAGNPVTKTEWYADEWQGVDFPFKAVKPEVIEATGRALREKIFDALGVLPEYRNPDPIVIGQIIPPHRPNDPLAFFVAWWMDPKDL